MYIFIQHFFLLNIQYGASVSKHLSQNRMSRGHKPHIILQVMRKPIIFTENKRTILIIIQTALEEGVTFLCPHTMRC